jgi:hypothetical protein
MQYQVVWQILTDNSEEITPSIMREMNALMMEATGSSESSVSIYKAGSNTGY